ncbi:MAG: 2-amino-4-hydroxy-6-hydroxymethyldihydropteridine diphosphokinase [Pseudomonadota bacterium]|nr:2-amino-4-hydroxy-6-hydroxymethyldihydropteridine diphosphokinase [Pseudomonadota bacterium]
MPVQVEAIIALGSDLAGDFPSVEALLEAAVARLDGIGLSVLRRSSLWASAAWPDASQPPYLNAVALVQTPLGPEEAMGALLGLERAFGRERGVPNAPRTLDLDLIDHGGVVLEGPDLVLPHPRAHERLFVMGPLAEIAPDWRHPAMGLCAAELAERATVGRDARAVSRPGSRIAT